MRTRSRKRHTVETTFMQPHDQSDAAFRTGPPPASPKAPGRTNTVRYGVTIVLLMAIVGGLAWVAQYLPSWRKPAQKEHVQAKKLLVFPRAVADWRTNIKEGAKEQPTPADVFKYVKPGDDGHYDFLFKNESDHDVDLVHCKTSCDCESVQACVLASDEWDAVNKAQMKYPGVPLPYYKEPDWKTLPPDPEQSGGAGKGEIVRLKAGEGGAVRVNWRTKFVPEPAPLNLSPELKFQAANDSASNGKQKLIIPAMIVPPLQVDPARVSVGLLTAGKSSTAHFIVWSATEENLDPSLSAADPLFVFAVNRLTKEEAATLQRNLHAKGMPAKVNCAYRFDVTVYENKAGKFLDQGVFFRKFLFSLKGKFDPNVKLYSPEIVGRVAGDITIGGTESQGRISFKSFRAKDGASKEVTLSTDAKVVLEKVDNHPDQPAYLKINLTRGDVAERATWHLEVTVPPGKAQPGPFVEPSAVVLRIAGKEARLLRIPLEGHITR